MPFDLKRIRRGVGGTRPPTLSLPAAVSMAGIALPPALSSGWPGPGLLQRQRVPEPAHSPGEARALQRTRRVSESWAWGGGSLWLHHLQVGTPWPAGEYVESVTPGVTPKAAADPFPCSHRLREPRGNHEQNACNVPEAEQSCGTWTEQPRTVGWKRRWVWTEDLSENGFARAPGT